MVCIQEAKTTYIPLSFSPLSFCSPPFLLKKKESNYMVRARSDRWFNVQLLCPLRLLSVSLLVPPPVLSPLLLSLLLRLLPLPPLPLPLPPPPPSLLLLVVPLPPLIIINPAPPLPPPPPPLRRSLARRLAGENPQLSSAHGASSVALSSSRSRSRSGRIGGPRCAGAGAGTLPLPLPLLPPDMLAPPPRDLLRK